MAVVDTEILAEIAWFNGQFVHLKDTFVSWIKEEGHEVDISEEKILKKEELSGQYSTFRYTIIIDKNIKLCLVPYGIWIVAAKGRVDISGPSGSEKLIYLFNNIDEEGWYWYDDSTIRKTVKLSKELLVYLIGRLQ